MKSREIYKSLHNSVRFLDKNKNIMHNMGTHRKFYLNTTKWSVYATGLVLVERIEQWTTGAVSWEEILKDHQWTARQLLLWTGGQRGSLMESSLVPRSAVALPLLWGRWQAARGRGVVCEKARQLHYAMSKSSMCWCDQRAVGLWTQICALQERERERRKEPVKDLRTIGRRYISPRLPNANKLTFYSQQVF